MKLRLAFTLTCVAVSMVSVPIPAAAQKPTIFDVLT